MHARLVAAGLVVLLAAACGGGGGGSSPAPAVATPAPTVAPALPPSSSAIVTASGGTAAFATITGGYGGSATLPAASSGTGKATLELSTSNASGPALASLARLPQSIGSTGLTGLAYVMVTVDAAVTFSTFPAFTFTVPVESGVAQGAKLYLAYNAGNSDSSKWTTLAGPVALSGTTVTFPAASGPITFAAGTTYAFALFTTTAVVPSAAPSASATTTASPTPSATATASSSASSAPSPSGTAAAQYACTNAKFYTDQANFAAHPSSTDLPEDVCGTVTSVMQAVVVSGSKRHGYFWVQVPPLNYQIQIYANLVAMAEASTDQPPATWPWVSAGQYAVVRGRYFYDNANSQGIDWTEDDTSGSWSQLGYVVVCDAAQTTCAHYW